MGVREWAGMHPAGHQSGKVGHVDKELGPNLIGDGPKSTEIEHPRIRRSASNNHFRPVLACERILAGLDGRPPGWLEEQSRQALAQVPHAAHWARSLPLGSVRLTEQHVHHDPVDPSELAGLRAAVAAGLQGVAFPAAALVVGVAGTVTSLATMAESMTTYDPAVVQGYRLSRLSAERQQLQRDHERLQLAAARLGSAQRIADLARVRLGMGPPPPDRVIVLVGGALRPSATTVAVR